MNHSKHTVEMAKGTISAAGQETIQTALYDSGYPRLPSDWKWVAMVGGKGEYVGTFAKRLSKYQHKLGNKLTSDFMGRIGSLVAQYTASSESYVLDYTSDLMWEEGEFGDNGSCYYDRTGVRPALTEFGCLGVRFYNDNKGMGRAWLAPYRNGWIVFNGYGHETSTIAQVVSVDLGMPYKRIALTVNGEDNGEVWINGPKPRRSDCGDTDRSGIGYYIGNAPIEFNARIDLTMPVYDTCHNCGSGCDDMTTVDGHDYCRECLHDNFAHCDDCNSWVSNDNVTYIGDNCVCEDCIGNYSYCEHCEEYHSETYSVDDSEYCYDCRYNNCTECSDCSEWHVETTEVLNGSDVCNDCLASYTECDKCGEWTPDSDIELGHCPDCVENLPTCGDCGSHCLETTSADGKEVCADCLDNYDNDNEFGVYVKRGQLCLV